ncbi:MAG TPA: DUF1697 domain-containing protein [Candidatus Polarisedimenticolia bacterium]|nr:DUF1697 domain-containing protein [Candidatus Polarisedimenticolia bacterium]
MALVALLRGVNVGGHRTFRPTVLARQLEHLDIVNIGAAGTFVIRRPVSPARLKAELSSRIPFTTQIMIVSGQELLRVAAGNHFASQPEQPGTVRFVSVLSRIPRAAPAVPINLPSSGQWLLRILGRERRFVFGLYRRHMKAIRYLQTLDRLYGVPVTTRSLNTIAAIASVLGERAP